MNRYQMIGGIGKERKRPFGIFTDQAGYLTKSGKRAVIPFECEFYEIIDRNNKTVFSGETETFGEDAASGDTVCIADFTGFKQGGEYRVKAGGKISAVFTVGNDVYGKVLDSTAKAFYYLRCGCGLDEKYAGVWKHGKCHTDKAVLWDDRTVSADVSGGWHDAGDYGRYVTAGAVAAAQLLYAFRLFPKVFEDRRLGIPEENGMPDILAEVKYELEWLMKMQRSDGSVYHKVTTEMHAPFVMPEEDTETLYLFPASSMAAADLTAVCALAAEIYRKYDAAFADRLEKAARISLKWLDENPAFLPFVNPDGVNTGWYAQYDDSSNRFWAYAEMYALTGEKTYEDKLLPAIKKQFPLSEFGYAETGGLGALAYLLCGHEKDDVAAMTLKDEFTRTAGYLKKLSDKCGYGTAMNPDEYYWGSNMTVLKRGMIFAVCDILNGTSYREYAARQIHYILGCNPLGISYITGTGEYCSRNPHLRPAYADGIEECIPGMVTGGPNKDRNDPFAKEYIAEGTPPMKCYADITECYSLNEITIYWNSPAVFVLAFLCDEDKN